MPKKEQEGKVLKTVSVYPPDRSWDDRKADYRVHMESGQRLEIDNRGKLAIVKEVPDYRPKQIFVISDWHLGSVAADMDAMDNIFNMIMENPDALVIFAGDEIEGWSGGKHSQSIDAKADLDAQQQIEFMREMYFRPLAESGKILGMVSEYWAHPGWLSEKTVNIWRTMVGDLDIDLLQNGGSIYVKCPKQTEKDWHEIKVWHNPPKGSRYDEVAGQRNVMLGTSESSRPDGSVAGHIHQMQVAQEMYAGAKWEVYYVSAGTVKGINSELPGDLYATQLGFGGTSADPQGEGVISIPRKGRRQAMNIPFASVRHGQVLNDAVNLLDRVEQLGAREELLELIHDKKKGVEEAPVISYPAGSNRLGERYKEERPPRNIVSGGETIRNPYSQVEMKSPYSVLSMEIKTQLPVALELISNARIGSTVEGYKDLKGFLGDVAQDPHKLVLFLRNMIDKEAGRLPNRIDVLDKFVNLINGTGEYAGVNQQTLAIMMCESMRQNDWKKQIKIGEEYGDDGRKHPVYDPPIAPASYVSEMTNIPLIHHLSLLKLAIGPGNKSKTLYPIVTADKAGNFGSTIKPEWGAMRLYDLKIHEKPAAVVGTHMDNAGAATFYDGSNAYTHYPMLVVPGWWAGAMDALGKGNAGVGAEPGQAIIFMPGTTQAENLAFAGVSKEETEYMHDALMLLKGLEILGLKDRVIKKTK